MSKTTKPRKKMRNYQEHEVVEQLNQKNDIRISGKSIQLLIGAGAKGDVGNKSSGKIHFLKNYCGYSVIRVYEFI